MRTRSFLYNKRLKLKILFHFWKPFNLLNIFKKQLLSDYRIPFFILFVNYKNLYFRTFTTQPFTNNSLTMSDYSSVILYIPTTNEQNIDEPTPVQEPHPHIDRSSRNTHHADHNQQMTQQPLRHREHQTKKKPFVLNKKAERCLLKKMEQLTLHITFTVHVLIQFFITNSNDLPRDTTNMDFNQKTNYLIDNFLNNDKLKQNYITYHENKAMGLKCFESDIGEILDTLFYTRRIHLSPSKRISYVKLSGLLVTYVDEFLHWECKLKGTF